MIKEQYKYSELTSKIIGCAMTVHAIVSNIIRIKEFRIAYIAVLSIGEMIKMTVPPAHYSLNNKETELSAIFDKPKTKVIYEYDFGDGWQHDV